MSDINKLKASPSDLRKRLEYNDIAKAIGMLVIIWAHIRLGDWSNSFAYAWHIPLFFFLSGMVFNPKRYVSFKVFLTKKIESLFIPYVIFSFITWIIWVLFSKVSHSEVENIWNPLLQTFIAQGSGGYLVHNVPLWFVTCLIMMEFFYYGIYKLDQIWGIGLSFLLAFVSFCLITYVDTFDVTLLPWNIEVAFLGMPFFSIGNFVVAKWGHLQIQNWVSSYKTKSLLLVLFLGILTFIGSYYNGSISFGHATLHNPFITYPCTFTGITMVLLISMLLASSSKCKEDVIYMRLLKWFGRNSFTTMAIHNPIKGVACIFVGGFLHCGTKVVSSNSYYAFGAFGITLIMTLIAIFIVNKIKKIINH